MSENTGYHDVNGIPIHVGDLIRIKHYQYQHGKRQTWNYFRVTKQGEWYVMHDWDDLNPASYRFLLSASGVESAEVLAESGLTARKLP